MHMMYIYSCEKLWVHVTCSRPFLTCLKWHDFWLQPNLNLRFATSKVHVQLPEIAAGRFMLLCFLVQAVWDPKSVNSPSEWLYSLHFSNAIQELWIPEPFVCKLLTKSASPPPPRLMHFEKNFFLLVRSLSLFGSVWCFS